MAASGTQREQARYKIGSAIRQQVLESENPPLAFLEFFAEAEAPEARRILKKERVDPPTGSGESAGGGELQ